MNRPLLRFVCLPVLALAVSGCSNGRVEIVGMIGPLNFQGLKVTLPNNGKGEFDISSDTLEWRHAAIVIFVKNLGDGTFEVRRGANGPLLGKAKKGEHIRFSDDGLLLPDKE